MLAGEGSKVSQGGWGVKLKFCDFFWGNDYEYKYLNI